jgi:hypothetical protein
MYRLLSLFFCGKQTANWTEAVHAVNPFGFSLAMAVPAPGFAIFLRNSHASLLQRADFPRVLRELHASFAKDGSPPTA